MKTRGAITFVFDDGYQVIHEVVVPLLDRLALPGVFAIPLTTKTVAQTEDRPVTPWQQWQHIHARHEIAAHSIDHLNLTTCDSTQLAHQLQEPQQTLHATTLVYPGGAFNQTVQQAASSYYTAARTVQRGLSTLPPRQPLQLPTYNFTRHNFSVSRANYLATVAWVTNRWLIETYHLIDNNEHEKLHAVKLDDFTRHLQFVKYLPVRVSTIRDIMSA
ncbi:MAG: polysaccharide deacetylase family protein [Candidatus Andersenbacteria bacterium]